MKIKIKKITTCDVKYLEVEVGVRYWEDAEVDDMEDTEGKLIPCREGDYWNPVIDIETGQIINWEKGVKARIHYKVCDDGRYRLYNDIPNEDAVFCFEGYVPDCMCPKSKGWGDYIIMYVNEEGYIDGWRPELISSLTTNELQ